MAENTEIPQDFPLPPASFEFLVESILMQTQMQLGLFRLRQDDDQKSEPNLPLAKHSIDMLGMLQDKTRGNLSIDEQRLLENGLTELRFRYIQVADEQKRVTQPARAVEEKKEDKGPLIITADGGKGSKTE